MNKNSVEKHIPAAQEALCSFLGTLLGEQAPLKIEGPEPIGFDDARVRAGSYMVLLAGNAPADRFAVMIDNRWLPLLSKSMLGEPIAVGEPGADDLLRELAAQGYGAVRTQLSAANVNIAEVTFELLEPGEELSSGQFGPDLAEVTFSLMFQGEQLGGFAVLPVQNVPDAFAQKASGSGAAAAPVDQPMVDVSPAAFPDLGDESIGGDGANGSFTLLAEIELEVTVELGRRRLPLADVLRLTTGSVIELEKLVGEPLEVYANGRLIAEGEAVVIDEQFGIRITNLASTRQRAKAFL